MSASYLKIGVVIALVLSSISLGLAIFLLSTYPHKLTAESVSVIILESRGNCGSPVKALSLLGFDGEYAVIKFEESATVPCFRHVLQGIEVIPGNPTKVKITLKLEKTSDICIQCVGVIESELKIGPIKPGTEIIVNGVSLGV